MKTHASAGKRFVAFIIDWYLSSLIGSIPIVILQSIRRIAATICMDWMHFSIRLSFYILLLFSFKAKQKWGNGTNIGNEMVASADSY